MEALTLLMLGSIAAITVAVWRMQVAMKHIQQHLETHLHYFPYNEKPYYEPYKKE